MESTDTFIVSDLHLGSRFCHFKELMTFLESLPPGAALVMNGDTVDRWHPVHHYLRDHQPAFDWLARESHRRSITWVLGNHDYDFVVPDPGRMTFPKSHHLGKRLYISHGYDFDRVMPFSRWFIRAFRHYHHLRIWLGADPVHVADYAKRFRRLYDVLCRNVRGHAVEYAKANGYEAVTCGHTHFVEDCVQDGIRYINTGAWTETPLVCLQVTPSDMRLVKLHD